GGCELPRGPRAIDAAERRRWVTSADESRGGGSPLVDPQSCRRSQARSRDKSNSPDAELHVMESQAGCGAAEHRLQGVVVQNEKAWDCRPRGKDRDIETAAVFEVNVSV